MVELREEGETDKDVEEILAISPIHVNHLSLLGHFQGYLHALPYVPASHYHLCTIATTPLNLWQRTLTNSLSPLPPFLPPSFPPSFPPFPPSPSSEEQPQASPPPLVCPSGARGRPEPERGYLLRQLLLLASSPPGNGRGEEDREGGRKREREKGREREEGGSRRGESKGGGRKQEH